MSSPAVRIDAVAGELGYASRVSFERAYTRWFGTTPAGARRALLES